MIKTFKHFRLNLMLMTPMFLLLHSVQAQPINFSSDHWPKRWGRAMNKPDMTGYFLQSNRKPTETKKVSHQGWGQQRKEKRNRRPKTPDYSNATFDNRYENEFLKRRYAIPGSMPYSSGYAGYPMNNYYGNYSVMPSPIYQGIYPGSFPGGFPGTFPGLYSGMGVPGLGFPYSSPFLLAPGLTPGLTPGLGYPW